MPHFVLTGKSVSRILYLKEVLVIYLSVVLPIHFSCLPSNIERATL